MSNYIRERFSQPTEDFLDVFSPENIMTQFNEIIKVAISDGLTLEEFQALIQAEVNFYVEERTIDA